MAPESYPTARDLQERNERVRRMLDGAKKELQLARDQYRQVIETEFLNEYLRREMTRQAEALFKVCWRILLL